jgi:hypothetical protein
MGVDLILSIEIKYFEQDVVCEHANCHCTSVTVTLTKTHLYTMTRSDYIPTDFPSLTPPNVLNSSP